MPAVNLTAAAAPVYLTFSRGLSFDVQLSFVGGESQWINVHLPPTGINPTINDLVVDLNNALREQLASDGFDPDTVRAEVVAISGGPSVLRFVSDLDPAIIGLDTRDAQSLGFQGSEVSVVVNQIIGNRQVHSDISSKGIPPGSVDTHIELVLDGGSTVGLSAPLSFMTLEGNTTLDALASDLDAAIGAALGSGGLPAGWSRSFTTRTTAATRSALRRVTTA